VPRVSAKAELGITALTLEPVPEVFWQWVQWQARSAETGALTV
jgi:hypothetical protein